MRTQTIQVRNTERGLRNGMGGTGNSPLPVSDPPTGMGRHVASFGANDCQTRAPFRSVRRVAGQNRPVACATRTPHSAPRNGFTLIELLVVIAIMAILAGFTLVVVTQIKKVEYVNTATAELSQITTALESYKTQYGSYPPSNPNTSNPNCTLLNPLYYELSGVTNKTVAGVNSFVTLDGASTISSNDYANLNVFDIGGVLNCAKTGMDTESANPPKSFLPALKANRIGTITDANGNPVNLLVTSVRGPDTTYKPLTVADVNPFRYLYPGTNNPNSYDLWVQLQYRGKKYLVCNWSKTAVINSSLP